MISEGPALIEALSGPLQNALNGALQPGEELRIAVRGNTREAFAATEERILILREPLIAGTGPVEVTEALLVTLSDVRSEPRPVGGRLMWEASNPGVPTSFDYPTYDTAKFTLVAKRLREMIGQKKPNTPGTAPGTPEVTVAAPALAGARSCPKCQTPVPGDGNWCPRCGLQVSDPCWTCGRPLTPGENFCAGCGTPHAEPAVVQCRRCQAVVTRGQVYCTACGAQARIACVECERPMRREWKFCPACGGEPEWEEEGVGEEPARLQGEPDDPSAWLNKASRKRDAAELNAAGAAAYEKGDVQEAVRLFREAVESDPRNAGFHVNLGVALGEAGDDLAAFAAYRRATELEPKEASAYLNMGFLYLERERPTEAREMWETVIRLAPDSEEAKEARENLKSIDEI